MKKDQYTETDTSRLENAKVCADGCDEVVSQVFATPVRATRQAIPNKYQHNCATRQHLA